MVSRTCQRAVIGVLKVYTLLAVLFLCASYTWRYLEETQTEHNNLQFDNWFQNPKAAGPKPKVYHQRDRSALSITAEDALKAMDFDSPMELTSRVHPSKDTPFLSGARVGMQGPMRILSWTIKHLQQSGPWFEEGTKAFDSCELEPWMECVYSHDRSLLNLSEAILFHPQHIFDLPKYRLSNQKWVFWELDSPQVTWEENPHLDRYGSVFNITSTYLTDSTVPIPYVHMCNARQNRNKMQDVTRGKDSLVAWLSFSCHSPSKREAFVTELQKYVSVDVFGSCGPLSCKDLRGDQCIQKIIQKKYKFFLVMEDSFCSNVPRSQALWRIFAHNIRMVPVVLGAANYSDLYPTGTYIDARSFKSVKRLSEYLQFLDKNDFEYRKFFINRGRPVCEFTTNYSQYMCQLCRHLHNHRRQKELAPSVNAFWNVKKSCVQADVFYSHYYKQETSSPPWWSMTEPSLLPS